MLSGTGPPHLPRTEVLENFKDFKIQDGESFAIHCYLNDQFGNAVKSGSLKLGALATMSADNDKGHVQKLRCTRTREGIVR